ncbi:hypothetical protein Xsto_01847 [Xenorhabdus stockiae]|uniref:Uncharacterized protein n=1 Tax=Xenorhabdus stockiae TaxID=351614 RepID=A0A2D0KQW3_9GAMM|nr:hypothetical protein Xsto_01847 [Xenorhabdus stockiae]
MHKPTSKRQINKTLIYDIYLVVFFNKIGSPFIYFLGEYHGNKVL